MNHGKHSTYTNHKCRCEPCRQANVRYIQRYRLRKAAKRVVPAKTPTLKTVPLTLKEANALVAQLHRHHKPRRVHRISFGAKNADGKLVGAAILANPIGGRGNPDNKIEVARLVTDGTPNACSFLYGVAARMAKEWGCSQIITYILESESGTSLKASGWRFDGNTVPVSWGRSRDREDLGPVVVKQRWVKDL